MPYSTESITIRINPKQMYMNHTTDSSSETLGLRDMAPVASLPTVSIARFSSKILRSNLSLFAEVLCVIDEWRPFDRKV
jgi:hypothetical protein